MNIVERQLRPKVSVCVITYNHARFIRECLQSIIDQETGFPFEVIVGDDASTDGTREIVAAFADKYEGRVSSVLQDANTGGTPNYFAVHEKASGEYVAHLDGDDMMLPGKLQKQADFLDQHAECTIVAHDLRIVAAETRSVIADHFCDIAIPQISDIKFLILNRCFFGHSSKMYRRSAVISRFGTRPTVDFYLHIEHASKGNIGYIHEVLGEYRKSSGSLSDPLAVSSKDQVEAHYGAFDRALELKVDAKTVNRGRLQFNYSIACRALLAGDHATFKRFIDLKPADYRHATRKHRWFYRVRGFPALVVMMLKLKDLVYMSAWGKEMIRRFVDS